MCLSFIYLCLSKTRTSRLTDRYQQVNTIRNIIQLGVLVHAHNPSTQVLRQEDDNFEASQANMLMNLSLKGYRF